MEHAFEDDSPRNVLRFGLTKDASASKISCYGGFDEVWDCKWLIDGFEVGLWVDVALIE